MLTYYEQRAIDVLRPAYNILLVARSSLGFRHSDETRSKLSMLATARVPRTGFSLSEEAKQKISVANSGRGTSAETREKLRKARAGKTPAAGLVHTPEAKAAMSAARKGTKRRPESVEAGAAKLRGVPRPEEVKAKLSAAMKGRKRSPESVAKMVATRKHNQHISLNALRKANTNG
jgi:hypothetical protein